MNKLMKLKEILTLINNFVWSDAIFIKGSFNVWDLDTICAVLDPDDVENEEDEEPKYAIENGLKYALSIQEVKGIIDNAFQQKDDCSEGDLLNAFLFYFRNDAFIEF